MRYKWMKLSGAQRRQLAQNEAVVAALSAVGKNSKTSGLDLPFDAAATVTNISIMFRMCGFPLLGISATNDPKIFKFITSRKTSSRIRQLVIKDGVLPDRPEDRARIVESAKYRR